MEGATPARLYALLVGGLLVVLGMGGFFYDASFHTGEEVRSDLALGILAVNGWHNMLHIATGALGLAVAELAARAYALGLGAAYAIVAVLGFVAVESASGIAFVAENRALFDLIAVNNEDNVLHAVLGATGIAAGIATRRTPRA